jgi:hypothetical protein
MGRTVDKQLQFWPNDSSDVAPIEPAPNVKPSHVEHVSTFQNVSPDTPPQLITSGVIARECYAPIHRVRWVLDTRDDIKPAAYAGNVRLFTRAAVARVRYELNAIDARRATKGDATK